jgi:hypothetical protein
MDDHGYRLARASVDAAQTVVERLVAASLSDSSQEMIDAVSELSKANAILDAIVKSVTNSEREDLYNESADAAIDAGRAMSIAETGQWGQKPRWPRAGRLPSN